MHDGWPLSFQRILSNHNTMNIHTHTLTGKLISAHRTWLQAEGHTQIVDNLWLLIMP